MSPIGHLANCGNIWHLLSSSRVIALSLYEKRNENMHKDGDKIDVTEEEASGGVKNVGLRYVLAISLLLAIIILSAMWMTGALLN
jgi:hypothetical protein